MRPSLETPKRSHVAGSLPLLFYPQLSMRDWLPRQNKLVGLLLITLWPFQTRMWSVLKSSPAL